MSLEQLSYKLSEIDNNLKQLSSEREHVLEQIKYFQDQETLLKQQQWNLREGDYVLMFAKQDNAFYIIRTMKILDYDDSYYYSIMGEYVYGSDFRIRDDKPIKYSTLRELEQSYHIYVVKEKTYNKLILEVASLDISYSIWSELIEKYKNLAIRIIS